MALGRVHPVTLAVGNTMKRVFILVASVMVFHNPISVQTCIGSGVGIAGVLLYSLTKQYYEALETAEVLASSTHDQKGAKVFADGDVSYESKSFGEDDVNYLLFCPELRNNSVALL